MPSSYFTFIDYRPFFKSLKAILRHFAQGSTHKPQGRTRHKHQLKNNKKSQKNIKVPIKLHENLLIKKPYNS